MQTVMKRSRPLPPARRGSPEVIDIYGEMQPNGQQYRVTVLEPYTPEMGREDWGAAATVGNTWVMRRPAGFKALADRPLPADGNPFAGEIAAA